METREIESMDSDNWIGEWVESADCTAEAKFADAVPDFTNQVMGEIEANSFVDEWIDAGRSSNAEQAFECNLPQFKKKLLTAIHGGDDDVRRAEFSKIFAEAAEAFDEVTSHAALSNRLKQSSRDCCTLLVEIREAIATCTADDDDNPSPSRITAAFVRAHDLRQVFEGKVVETLEQFRRTEPNTADLVSVVCSLESAVKAYFLFIEHSLGEPMPDTSSTLAYLYGQGVPDVLALLEFSTKRANATLLQPSGAA